MKLNSKVRYGLRTMVEIAKNPEGILQKYISENQAISTKYLDQIIAALKAAGLITRVSGKASGYRLNSSPEKISIYDIYKAFEYELNINSCNSRGIDCPLIGTCQAKDYWCDLNTTISNHMKNKTLANLLSEAISKRIT